MKEEETFIMLVLDLICILLTSYSFLEFWFSDNSWLLEYRAATQEWKSPFFRELLNCRFCLSYHMPWWVMILLYSWTVFLDPPWDIVSRFPLYLISITGALLLIEKIIPTVHSGNDSTFSPDDNFHEGDISKETPTP